MGRYFASFSPTGASASTCSPILVANLLSKVTSNQYWPGPSHCTITRENTFTLEACGLPNCISAAPTGQVSPEGPAWTISRIDLPTKSPARNAIAIVSGRFSVDWLLAFSASSAVIPIRSIQRMRELTPSFSVRTCSTMSAALRKGPFGSCRCAVGGAFLDFAIFCPRFTNLHQKGHGPSSSFQFLARRHAKPLTNPRGEIKPSELCCVTEGLLLGRLKPHIQILGLNSVQPLQGTASLWGRFIHTVSVPTKNILSNTRCDL